MKNSVAERVITKTRVKIIVIVLEGISGSKEFKEGAFVVVEVGIKGMVLAAGGGKEKPLP